MLYEYFTNGTQNTKTGAQIGLEIETDFVYEDGYPITRKISALILQEKAGRPKVCKQKLELGRQKIELSIVPMPNFRLAYEASLESLNWLYSVAANYGAHPLFQPDIDYDDPLLWIQEKRDEIWLELDGYRALEQLCRCSSVQFNVDVNPHDAISIINKLLKAKTHEYDYSCNHKRWLMYIAMSEAKYLHDRYGGPDGFENLKDYCNQLAKHDVVMHKRVPVHSKIDTLRDADIDLFIRSIWLHNRIRVAGEEDSTSEDGNRVSYVESRSYSRRSDEAIATTWSLIAPNFGL